MSALAPAPVGSSVELAPAESLGAAPVLAFLAPWVLLGVSVVGSECAEFGLLLSGPIAAVAAAAESVSARFGRAVLVGPLEPLFG